MPDITQELQTIASDPRGHEVKKAIYDALSKINAAADIRPPAKREVPIGEAICDTGFITQFQIGEVELGQAGFGADIQNGFWFMDDHTGYAASSVSVYAGTSGRVFAVIVDDGDTEYDIPTITDESDVALTWSQVTSFTATMSMYDGQDGSQIAEENPDKTFTIKGILADDELLPVEASDGDVYIRPAYTDILHPNPRTIYAYCSVSGQLATWTNSTRDKFKRTVSKRVTVWTAVVPSATPIKVVAEVLTPNTNPPLTDDIPMTLGVFYASDSSTEVVSEMPYRVCLKDDNGFYGVKKTSDTWTYQGTISVITDLPSTPVNQTDAYYYSGSDDYYVWDTTNSEWIVDQTMYYTGADYISEGCETGLSSGTRKIFVVASLVPFSNFKSAIYPPTKSGKRELQKAVCPTGESCMMSAWFQKSDSTSQPKLTYANGREQYRWICDGSVAIVPIEIGERSV